MSQYGMGDEATIDEVIEDVDTDKVKILSFDLFITICWCFLETDLEIETYCAGWKYQLRGICNHDEKVIPRFWSQFKI